MKKHRVACVVLLLGLGFIVIQAVSNPVLACDRLETTALGTFEQCRWYRYDARTNMLRFCMRFKRLMPGVDPIFVAPYLKSGGLATTIKELESQPVSLEVGECKTVCWQFSKPEDLDLNQFYEYTDLDDKDGSVLDYIWRTDRITGYTVSLSAVSPGPVETIVWPLFNMRTEALTMPIQVVTVVDQSDALPGWQVVDIYPAPGSPFTLHPGEQLTGTITIQKPAHSDEGVAIIRPQLMNIATGEIVQEVNLRFMVDHTLPEVMEASAQRAGDYCLFRVIAADTYSGVADAVQVHLSVNGGPFESFFLDSFAVPPGAGPFILDSPCVTLTAPTVFTTTLGPFKSTDLIQYFFTIPDEAGNTVQTAPATIQVSRPSISKHTTNRQFESPSIKIDAPDGTDQ